MLVSELNERSREIFRLIVDSYVQTGDPVGSRTLSRRLADSLSPATIRNVMADLEDAGLLCAPHPSAGRIPTEAGLRLFVNGLLEIDALGDEAKDHINAHCAAQGYSLPDTLTRVTTVLAGLSHCASLVLAPKTDRPLKHIEFVHLAPGRALVVMITEDGLVENRLIEVPIGLPLSSLQAASNYLTAHVVGRTLDEAQQHIRQEIAQRQTELDALTHRVVEAGLATWAGLEHHEAPLIVRGQSQLLDDVTALEDLERIRALFEALETRETLVRLLDATGQGDGVQIFIGAENDLFRHSGCSMIVAPYQNGQKQIMGAIGVLGPTRMNYARIIPMVDYTARMISRLMGGG